MSSAPTMMRVRHRDARQPVEHVGVLLRQRAARGQHEPGRITVLTAVQLRAAAHGGQSALAKAGRGHLGPAVPVIAGSVIAVAGTGVDEDQPRDAIRIPQREGERQVTAQRVPAEDSPVKAAPRPVSAAMSARADAEL